MVVAAECRSSSLQSNGDERGKAMSEVGNRPGPNVLLSLAENHESTPVRSAWIGPILALGTRLARMADTFADRQLIVTVSVPSREYAAVLIGVGWTLGRPPAQVATDPLSVLRGALPRGNYRALNATHVISGTFQGLDESRTPARVALAGHWAVDRLEAVVPVAESDPAEKMPRPQVGSIGRMSGVDRDWARRLVAPAADLAICMAIASAAAGRRMSDGLVVFGEVGLGGEIRSVPGVDQRIAEAKKLGFTEAIGPPLAHKNTFLKGSRDLRTALIDYLQEKS